MTDEQVRQSALSLIQARRAAAHRQHEYSKAMLAGRPCDRAWYHRQAFAEAAISARLQRQLQGLDPELLDDADVTRARLSLVSELDQRSAWVVDVRAATARMA